MQNYKKNLVFTHIIIIFEKILVILHLKKHYHRHQQCDIHKIQNLSNATEIISHRRLRTDLS